MKEHEDIYVVVVEKHTLDDINALTFMEHKHIYVVLVKGTRVDDAITVAMVIRTVMVTVFPVQLGKYCFAEVWWTKRGISSSLISSPLRKRGRSGSWTLTKNSTTTRKRRMITGEWHQTECMSRVTFLIAIWQKALIERRFICEYRRITDPSN